MPKKKWRDFNGSSMDLSHLEVGVLDTWPHGHGDFELIWHCGGIMDEAIVGMDGHWWSEHVWIEKQPVDTSCEKVEGLTLQVTTADHEISKRCFISESRKHSDIAVKK